MSVRPIPHYKLLPEGIDYVVDSDPDALRKRNGAPNVAAIARAASLSHSAFSRVITGKRPWAGYGTVQRVSGVAAKARNIPVEEAQRQIFAPVEEEIAA
jgi:hypothetical protein